MRRWAVSGLSPQTQAANAEKSQADIQYGLKSPFSLHCRKAALSPTCTLVSLQQMSEFVLGVETVSEGEPENLTRASIFVINTSLLWLVAALAIWFGAKLVAPVLAMIAIALVNAASHIASALAMGAYNPGLLTSIFIFAPLSIFCYASLWQKSFATGPQIIWSLAWSLAAHIIMVAGVIAANWWRLFPETAYFVLLVMWSILPTAWSWQTHTNARPSGESESWWLDRWVEVELGFEALGSHDGFYGIQASLNPPKAMGISVRYQPKRCCPKARSKKNGGHVGFTGQIGR